MSTSDAAAQDLAALLRELRRADTYGRTFSGKGRGGHLPDHDEWMETCFDQSAELLDTESLRKLRSQFRQLPRDDQDVMNHGDLIPQNILISDGRLAGVIDGGTYGPADPALDLIAAWHLFDGTRREVVRTELRSSDVEWHRGAAWAFQQAMGLVWYYERSNPTMARLGRSTLSRIQEDPNLFT